jgi:hypothetical protein
MTRSELCRGLETEKVPIRFEDIFLGRKNSIDEFGCELTRLEGNTEGGVVAWQVAEYEMGANSRTL